MQKKTHKSVENFHQNCIESISSLDPLGASRRPNPPASIKNTLATPLDVVSFHNLPLVWLVAQHIWNGDKRQQSH